MLLSYHSSSSLTPAIVFAFIITGEKRFAFNYHRPAPVAAHSRPDGPSLLIGSAT
jgi:hypothetical protein